MIETIIHEEHHEAFLLWHQAISKGLIDKKANTLIHIDSHDDFLCPVTDRDINQLSGDPAEIENYTYWQLTISSFIVPALYKKIFDELIWITPDHKTGPQEKEYCIRTIKEQGKQFVLESYNPFLSVNFPWHDRVKFSYIKTNTEHPIYPASKQVLDIDLDYFSCIKKPPININIEITEEEYHKIIADKYHPLRLVNKIGLTKENNRFYLRHQSQIIISGSRLDHDGILKRMEDLRDFLVRNKIKPSFINICRSVKSGYTPADQAVFIEDNLLKMLDEIYGVSVSEMGD